MKFLLKLTFESQEEYQYFIRTEHARITLVKHQPTTFGDFVKLDPYLQNAFENQRYIECIKIVRTLRPGLGLKEGKDIVWAERDARGGLHAVFTGA